MEESATGRGETADPKLREAVRRLVSLFEVERIYLFWPPRP